MNVKTILKNLPDRLLMRGEHGVAGIGVTTAALLILCCAANAWYLDFQNEIASAEQRRTQIQATGPLLAETAQRLIAGGDLVSLRRLTAGTAAALSLDTCTVSIGNDRVLADATPTRVNTMTLPERWTTTDDLSAGACRFPFTVDARGSGFVTLTASPIKPQGMGRFAVSASACAFALAVFVLIYHRSRRSLAELDVVRRALTAADQGETVAAALHVDERLGKTAVAWNKLMVELDALRERARSATSTAAAGNRRAGGSNLESACDAMSQGMVLVDDKMRVRFSNGAACTFLKLDRATLGGLAAVDLVPEDKFRDAIRAVASGTLRRPVVIELEQPGDNASGVLRVCVRPVRRGDSDSAMVIIEDITQQRTAERARNTFINQVTHELRTPLTNIRLYAETAIEDGEGNAEVRANCLNVINQESRRLERIVSEMLSVAEIEAGSSTIRRDEVYFDALVKDLQHDYAALAESKQIKLAFNVSPKLPKLTADKDKLAIAMHNLIGNALKYTPEGGSVTVAVDVRDNRLAIDVTDTGIGIEAADAEKIFDRFFRSADPRVGKIVGTGLGLTLAREVMRLHGGDITVESEINRGSTFTATMPVAMAA